MCGGGLRFARPPPFLGDVKESTMKVICKQTCYHSKSCRKYDQGSAYEIDDKTFKTMLDHGMAKYFATADGKAIPDPFKKDK